MSYLVLARKWRPRQFGEVVAQQHVTQTIANAIQQNRLASAYLFTGPRGVGKTTMARLLAKAVNCEQGPTATPCDQCTNCVEIAAGRSLDVIEIDGASNRGIDEVRNLRDNARFAPANSVKKIYIIDEVHMLTEAAFNALLKIIEEPPLHVLFIFATTEVHKVPATILSRCQRFDFRRVPLPEIMAQLKMICTSEGVEIDEASLALIAKRAEGSMRDSESLLDQVIAFCGKQVAKAEVSKLFGLIDQEMFFECTDAAINHDARSAVQLAEKIYSSGFHLGEFFERLAEHLSAALTTRLTSDTSHLIGFESYAERYRSAAAALTELELLQHLQIVTEAQAKLGRASNPRILLEMALLKMANPARSDAPSVVAKPPVPGASTNEPATSRASSKAPEASRLSAPLEAAAQVKSFEQPEALEPPLRVDGVTLVPQISRNVSNVTEVGPEMVARPEPANGGGLFKSSVFARVQGVPLMRAQEAPVPRAGQIENEAEALETIQAHWPKILEEVKARRISLGSFLEAGAPRTLSEGTLEVAFGSDGGFHLNTVNNQKTLIQQVIQAETGYSVRIICSKNEGQIPAPAQAVEKTAPAPPIKNGAVAPQPRSGTPSLQELFQNYPLVQKLVEAVDGEFIRCHVRP